MTRDWRDELVEQVAIADHVEFVRVLTAHADLLNSLSDVAHEQLCERINDARRNGKGGSNA
jgi:hypothetical protein